MVDMGGAAALAGLLMLGAAIFGCFIAATIARAVQSEVRAVLIGTASGTGFIVVSSFVIAGIMGR
ncbi:MAG: hypothetical protein QNJ20_07845 [Paracoccaceae bacterium]|nr:hypothetical protein [Paracoccaceae bacterium]